MNSNSNKSTIINKVTDIDKKIAKLCDTCIENKYTRIVKAKRIILITRKFQEIYADLLGLYNSCSLSSRNYIALLLDEFIRKSCVSLLRSKDKFFNIFKIWLFRAKSSGDKLDCFHADGGGKFISQTLKNLSNKRGINIKYATPYMYRENNIVERD